MDNLFVYSSPLGRILLAGGRTALTGLWFEGQKHCPPPLNTMPVTAAPGPVRSAVRWLDIYFSGNTPDTAPPLAPAGTPFQLTVWETLKTIPYGETVTYGELARRLALSTGRPVSARAVGGAVGRNPISILRPCHRVVGAGGRLTGYAGGTRRKLWLLELEKNR